MKAFNEGVQLNGLIVSGYKSFKEPTRIEFNSSNFACLAGRNNSGKTSVLELLALVRKSFVYPQRTSGGKPQLQYLPKSVFRADDYEMQVELHLRVDSFEALLPKIVQQLRTNIGSSHNQSVAAIRKRALFSSFIATKDKIIRYKFAATRQMAGRLMSPTSIELGVMAISWDNSQFRVVLGNDTTIEDSKLNTSKGNENGVIFNSLQISEPWYELFEVFDDWVSAVRFVDVDRKIKSEVQLGTYAGPMDDELTKASERREVFASEKVFACSR
jgi:hypothetical protein